MKKGDMVKIKSYSLMTTREARYFYKAGIIPSMPGRIEYIRRQNRARLILVRFPTCCLWVSKKNIESMNETQALPYPDFSDIKEVIKKIL